MFHHVTSHALQRYQDAHSLDPIKALLRMQEELAAAREVTADEARQVAGGPVAQQPNRTYLAGPGGVFVCAGKAVTTYIAPMSHKKKCRWLHTRYSRGRRR